MGGLYFFARADEQLAWLETLFEQVGDVWCWVEMPGYQYHKLQLSNLASLHLEYLSYPGHIRLYLGREQLSTPAWRRFVIKTTGNNVQKLDPTSSQAIIFDPSIAVDKVLLRGWMTIDKRISYLEAGIDPDPLTRWYNVIRRNFRKMMSKDYVVVSYTFEGISIVYREIGITPGAIKWRHSGNLLKPSIHTVVEFDVIPKQQESRIRFPIKRCPEGMRRCERCQGWTTVRMTPTSDDIPCPACQGAGCVPKRLRWCRRCSGSGRVQMNGQESLSLCPACSGIGIAPAETKWCKRCGGSGRIWTPSLLVGGSLTSQLCPECGGKGTM